MKRYVSIIIVALLLGCLVGCGSNSSSSGNAETNVNGDQMANLSVVATIFPLYDWTRNIVGDAEGVEVTLLSGKGVDIHSFQPSVEDLMKISTCDLFLYVGGESDGWIDDALAEAANKEMVVVNLLDLLGDKAKEEELAEGMQQQREAGGEGDAEPDEVEYDEHVWLSLRNAAFFVREIADALAAADEANAASYQSNAASYVKELDALDGRYQTMVDAAPVRTLLFGDRFPFRYLVDDYGLAYYAAFAGCSAETEASFETITFLAKKMDELSLPAVMTIEGSDKKIAQTIVNNTKAKDQQILTLDSMQSTTKKDAEGGTTYLSLMEKNLSVLTEALQ